MRVCFLSTAERGGRAEGLRLVGARTDDRWSAPSGEPDEVARHGAEWAIERLGVAGEGKSLGGLVVDVDGGVCSWLGTPSADRGVVRAMLEGDAWEAEEGSFAGSVGGGAARRFPALPGELEVEPLEGAGEGGGRIGVIATPGLPARELIDALDRRGVSVGWVCSLWQAIGAVWGGGEGGGGGGDSLSGARSDRVVADQAGLTASLVVDAPRGRALWVWSEGGSIVAAGSMRYGAEEREEDGNDADATSGGFGAEEAGRLTLDWLGWGSQLGRSPTLVRCVGDAGDGARLASAVAARWPTVSVDLVESEDAVLDTVRGLGESGASGGMSQTSSGGTLGELSARPGRAHRSMHIWAALAMTVGGGALGLVGYGWMEEASSVRMELGKISANREDILTQTDLAPGDWEFAARRLRERIDSSGRVQAPEVVMPVLEEFETITYVVSNQDWDLQELRFHSTACTVKLVVPDVGASEALEEAMGELSDRIQWSRPTLNERSNGVECTFTGTWNTDAIGGGP